MSEKPYVESTTPPPGYDPARERMLDFKVDDDLAKVVDADRKNFILTTVDEVFNWARLSSLWPVTFGLACCAIEMMAASATRYDIDRFGAGAFRPTPRQADLMIVAGTVTKKMAPQVVRLYNQMPDPKYVIAMGACAISGGPFAGFAESHDGADAVIPVDLYIPGCPPHPMTILDNILRALDRIE